MADQYRINGNVFGWASITLKIGGVPYSGFTLINYSDKLTRAYQYGMNRAYAPRGRTQGKYEIDECKIGGSKSSCKIVRGALAALAPDGRSYGNVEFQADVLYVEPGEGDPIHDVLEGCKLSTTSAQHSESPDPLSEEMAFSPMRIYWNGLTLFDSSQEP